MINNSVRSFMLCEALHAFSPTLHELKEDQEFQSLQGQAHLCWSQQLKARVQIYLALLLSERCRTVLVRSGKTTLGSRMTAARTGCGAIYQGRLQICF
jgi:hypothetical protein